MSNVAISKRRGLFARRARALKGDQDGAAAIEFALVGPVFLLTVIGLIEVSMMILVSVLLEAGIRESARFGLTGRAGDGGLTREEQIIQTVRDTTLGLVELEASQIQTFVYQNFSDIGQPETFTDEAPFNGEYDVGEAYDDANGNGQWDPDMGTPGAGASDEIVLYRVNAQWEALTPLFAPLMGEDGLIDLEASVAIRNEPF